MTELDWLCQSQAVRPLRIRSVSPSRNWAASRTWRGPPYQTFTVCEPVSRDAGEDAPPASGSRGKPRDAVSTTVPVSGGGAAAAANAASSCAGVRDGSRGAACATLISEPAVTAATTATAAAGTAQRV
jgi:hypothetical protein